MKRTIILMVLGLGFQTGICQIKYSDEGFHTPKVEKSYQLKTAGQQFIARMDALYAQSKPDYQLQTEYNQFVKEFQGLAKENTYKKQRMLALAEVLRSTNDQMYNQAGFRAKVYTMVHPLYLALKQNWGKEIIEMALAEAYMNVYEYLTVVSVDHPSLKPSMDILSDNEIIDRGEGRCTYTVMLTDKVAKDRIEIYFSDYGSYRRLSKNFSEAKLLQGPVPYWEDERASSQTIREMLDAYILQDGSPVKYALSLQMEKGKKRYSVELPKGMKWFVWVFRNERLYYHYMIEPCSFENAIEVLDIQTAPLEAVGDPNAYNFD